MARIRSVKPYKKRAIPQASRRALAIRYGAGGDPHQVKTPAACDICGATGLIYWPLRSDGRPGGWVHFTDLEIDHIVAEVRGGTHGPENLRLLCQPCNRRKGSK